MPSSRSGLGADTSAQPDEICDTTLNGDLNTPLGAAPAPNFDDTVSGLYRAATGDLSWRHALAPVAQMFGAGLALLHRADLAEQRMVSLHTAGMQSVQDATFQYLRHYHRIDPRRAQMMAMSTEVAGTQFHDHEHLDEAFVEQDPYYQQFLPGYGLRYLSAMFISPAPDQIVAFALELPLQRGVLDADERELLRRLGLHMTDALKAHERLRRLQAQQMAGHGVLQGLAHPMWLIDSDRFVHFANAPAQAEGERGRCLVQRGAYLAAPTQRLDRSFTEHVHALQHRGHGASAVLPSHGLGDDARLWLHLSLMVPEQVVGAFGRQPMVLVTLFDPGQISAVDPLALASLLGLTPAQARVAARLAAGQSPEAIALSSGIGLATVRSHVHAVLHRVGAQRAAELVRVLNDGHALWSVAPAAQV
jgi:DNA-binding CsgD family transcriptional regulator